MTYVNPASLNLLPGRRVSLRPGFSDHGLVFGIRKISTRINRELKTCNYNPEKGPVKLIMRVKIAHSFLQSVSNQFHVIILSLPM